jgi:hypothetical protein
VSELPIPPDAADESEAAEVLRAWIVGATLQCSIQADVFPDPATWGAVLADVARHVADAWQQQEGVSATETVQGILASFNEEMRATPGAEESA